MKRFILHTSYFILLVALFPQITSATPPTLYSRIRALTRLEALENSSDATKTEVEPIIKRYVAAVLAGRAVTPQDIDAAVIGDRATACSARAGRESLNGTDCDGLLQNIQLLVSREEKIRALGRDLQIIATGYELPLNGFAQSHTNLPLRAQSIIHIWQATNAGGSSSSAAAKSASSSSSRAYQPPTIRALPFPKSAYPALQKLLTELKNLMKDNGAGTEYDDFRGAVWRYQFGAGYLNGIHYPSMPLPPNEPGAAGTERQYLFKRWTGVEDQLKDILYKDLPKTFTPPLGANEVVIYQLQNDPDDPAANFKDQFADMLITVWAYTEPANGKPSVSGTISDAGLQWLTPLEPVLPALCKDTTGGGSSSSSGGSSSGAGALGCTPILGGRYPPEPPQTGGLCALPLSRSGYLCRDLSAQSNPLLCKQTFSPDKDATILAACTSREVPKETVSGPDVCQDIHWIQNQTVNPVTQCHVTPTCMKTPPAGIMTMAKVLRSGVGDITVPVAEQPDIPAEYQILLRLTQAQHICGLPALSFPIASATTSQQRNAACCRIQRDAYRTACEAMQQDGIFGAEQSLTFTATTCTDILADDSCRTQGYGVCADAYTNTMSDAQVHQLQSALTSVITRQWRTVNAKALGRGADYGTCSYWQNRLQTASGSTRIGGTLKALDRIGHEVCTPLTVTSFENTIGNATCYIGQCLEQSLEQHRLTAGRQPFTVQDQAYPWDACIASPKDAGAVLTASPELLSTLPVYRPRLLVQQLDAALCQVIGAPPETPPTRCAADVTRRLQLPLPSPLAQSLGILNGKQDSEIPTLSLQHMSEAIAVRLGTELYSRYLETSTRALSSITVNAANLLQAFSKVTFTRTMCPLNDANGSSLLNLPACSPN